MNLHVPQSYSSAVELQELAAVPYQIVSPATNSALVQLVQDSLLGYYVITNDDVLIDKRDMMNILMGVPSFNGVLPKPAVVEDKKEYWTGRQLVSIGMPRINMKSKGVVIENGELIKGRISKGASNTIIQIIYNDYGPKVCQEYLDNIQNIVTRFLVKHGFSIGVSDLIISDDVRRQIQDIIVDGKKQVLELEKKIHLNILTDVKRTVNETFEANVMQIMNQTTKKIEDMYKKQLKDDNRAVMMKNAGSKGKDMNIRQMSTHLGQQVVQGKRVPIGYTDRTLPHYYRYDSDVISRGFVENSFMDGLTPQESFFHAMGGREGLIDTAVKSVTGDTPIVIIENDQPKYITIGEWIDDKLYENKKNVRYEPENNNIELLDLDDNVVIPTTDYNGNVSWGDVTCVTRHDPGKILYQIKTLSGKSVIVTESKSLLVWNDKLQQFKEILTPEISVGDCVPTTSRLPEPPKIMDYIDMSIYYPKNQYIHGTDFNKAHEMMNDAMEGRSKIPAGWWNDNNGNEFELPYTKKSSLTRTVTRSDITNIKDGCIYPYHAKRQFGLMPDKFMMDYENGLFIGLYLAEGSSCTKSGNVQITNGDDMIMDFVETWFAKYSIKSRRIEQIKQYGITKGVVGCSCMLADFMERLVGKGARNKHIPDEAFMGSDEFIKGMLSGYFSGDGYISNNSVEVSSASYRLIEGISMLCTRLGIFGKMFTSQLKSNNFGTKNIAPANRFAIRAQWAQKFATDIKLIDSSKIDSLQNIKCSDVHRNFDELNDVVLDEIIEINEISPDEYPKMYDLTIPSTLNFGLANGLQVRDTSESGYIQRKLIKAMEDLKVYHDNTVRNANGDIVQFLYGYDGIDASGGIEGNRMELVTDEYGVLKDNLQFSEGENWETFMSKSAIKKMKQTKDWKKQLNGYFKDLMVDRDRLFEVFNYTANSNMEYLKAPFNAERIINNTIQTFKIRPNGLSDLTPLEVIDAVNDLCDHLTINEFPNFNFNLIVKTKFAPKPIIKKYRLTKLAFAHTINMIKMKFNEAIVQAGEMVGMLSAQSLGETSTQLTLNSVTGETKILINEDGINKVVNIGDWIDDKMSTKENRQNIKYIPENRTQYLELKEKVMIPSCDVKGKTGWHELTAVTKHLPVGDLVKITTHSGRTVTATQAKSFLTYDNKSKKLVRTNGSDIKVGDRVPITYNLDNDFETIDYLDVSHYLPKDKWLYGTDYNKAKKYYEKYVEERDMVKEHNKGMKKKDKRRIKQTMNFAQTFRDGEMFTLPYSRYDAFYDTLTPKKLNTTVIRKGYVYPKICREVCSKIPEKIELNEEFGFIVGIYLAEGWATDTFVGISNNDEIIQKKVYDWCDSISTTYHTVVTESKRFENSKSTDIKIHSVTLARLFKKWMNTGSSKKIVPAEAFTAPDEFVKGLLDGYISGDGTVSKKDGSVVVTSASEEMLMGVSNLMNRFGVFGKLTRMEIKKNNVGSKNIKPVYCLRVSNGFVQDFAKLVGSTHPIKDKRLNEITLEKDYKYIYGKNYKKLNNTMLDKIVNIEYIHNTDENGDMINVYDVTVPNTLNFTIFNCLNLDDTFHSAGAGATVTTQGVPRLRELLSNTKNMATPSSTLFLNEEARYTLEKALEVKYNIEITTIRDIVISCSIYNDPDNKFKSVVEEDRNILDIYKVFHEIDDNCREMKANPWVLRFKFDRSKMMERKISMDNIYQVITQSYSNAICIYSDDNSNDLVFRIRLDFVASADKADDDIKHLKKVENKILDLVVKGVDSIDGSHVSEHNINLVKDEVGNYVTKSERKLTTDGSNLVELINVNNVDFSRCYCNDINEIYALYGIEAARTILFNEFNAIFGSSDVNFRHIAMLCDIMTNQGIIMSIDRHGINRGTNGPLAKCSFEEAVDQLQKAAIHGDTDNLSGVSANIMMGQIPPSGTGDSTLILDELKLIETQEIEKPDEQLDIDEILNVSDYCQENVAINFNINKVKKKKINVKNIPKVKPE